MISALEHLSGKPLATIKPAPGFLGGTIIAGQEVAHARTLNEAILQAQQLTAGSARQGAFVMGGDERGYEVYLANLKPTFGADAQPFHFEGWELKPRDMWPNHTEPAGRAFVDGATVLLRS